LSRVKVVPSSDKYAPGCVLDIENAAGWSGGVESVADAATADGVACTNGAKVDTFSTVS
jgi:hypothetical protein